MKLIAVTGMCRASPLELRRVGCSRLLLTDPPRKEEAGLVHGMVHHVEEAADDARGHRRADPEHHVPHLADRVVGEEALVVLLDQRHHDGEQDGDGAARS